MSNNCLPEKHKESVEEMMMRVAIETLAKVEHEQWVHWMKYLKSKSFQMGRQTAQTNEDWEHWEEQMKKDYSELSEKEKDSDREWAKRVLEALGLDHREVMRSLIGAQIYGVNMP